jgi:hypothetical protein
MPAKAVKKEIWAPKNPPKHVKAIQLSGNMNDKKTERFNAKFETYRKS